MDVAALVVAIVSVLVAAGSLIYARRSADASHRSADASETSADAARESAWLQSESDWRARTPSFSIEWSDVIARDGDVVTYGATLESKGPEDYGTVRVRLLDPPAGEPAVLCSLIDLRGPTVGRSVDVGPVSVGQRIRLGLVPEFEEDERRRGGRVDLQVTARTVGEDSDVDEWTVPVSLEIPNVPRVFFG